VFDIYLLEAVINGVLLGGVLALLALGLNLIFGVIDVVWICYAELIMMGMYGMFYMVSVYHFPFLLAAVLTIALVSVMGVLLHVIVIAPLLNSPPINQLLATGGVLAFLQALATVLFGIDFRNLGIRLPVIEIGDMYISYARLLAFGTALAGMVAVYLFLSRTYTWAALTLLPLAALAGQRPPAAAAWLALACSSLRTRATTSCAMPIDGPPISSQAREIPTMKLTITKIAIVSTDPESPGWLATDSPATNW